MIEGGCDLGDGQEFFDGVEGFFCAVVEDGLGDMGREVIVEGLEDERGSGINVDSAIAVDGEKVFQTDVMGDG